ncbi:hypothetical protein P3T40_001126 [Paraburkholderia sp. EB58]|jgi:hypothetical protein
MPSGIAPENSRGEGVEIRKTRIPQAPKQKIRASATRTVTDIR